MKFAIVNLNRNVIIFNIQFSVAIYPLQGRRGLEPVNASQVCRLLVGAIGSEENGKQLSL